MTNKIIVLGATGNLGGKIVDALLANSATVVAIVRPITDRKKIDALIQKNVEVFTFHEDDNSALVEKMKGANCVVSALAGLENTILQDQNTFLQAAITAGVKRFIPSDYCLDFRNVPAGNNRNLDWRREFHKLLIDAPIAATSIFNGAFMELLTTDMPLILKKQKRILCWGNKNEPLEFTHTTDVAAFTANVALQEASERYLSIAGDVLSCMQFKELLTKLSGEQYKILRPGGIGLLNIMIKMTRFFSPSPTELYPAWQGMQYMRDMMEGNIASSQYDNEIFPQLRFISIEEFLKAEGISKQD